MVSGNYNTRHLNEFIMNNVHIAHYCIITMYVLTENYACKTQYTTKNIFHYVGIKTELSELQGDMIQSFSE